MSNFQDKPAWCFLSGCPLAEIATGFVPGCGNPKTAKYVAILEAPGKQEIQFRLEPPKKFRSVFNTQEECDAELALRKAAYPDVDESLLKRGVPVVGMTGMALGQWGFPPAGLRREDFFIDNTLRCLPPKNKKGQHYPIGDIQSKAELCCRHYDRVQEFKPAAVVLTLHPAGILREVTPLPLLIKDLEKVRDFTAAGLKVVLLLGGKAAKVFARCCDNVTRMRGAYFHLTQDWYERVVKRLSERSVEKKTRKKKTADVNNEIKPRKSRKRKPIYQEDLNLDPLALPQIAVRASRRKKQANAS